MNHEPTASQLPTARFGIHLAIYMAIALFAICFESVTRGTPSTNYEVPVANDAMIMQVSDTPPEPANLAPEPLTPREIRIKQIAASLRSVAGSYITTDEIAKLHAEAALEAEEQTGINANLLLGIGWVESRYNPDALSRQQCKSQNCKRITTPWPGVNQPPGSRPTWYCGVTQVGGSISWPDCQKLRENLKLNYLAGAKHLAYWATQKPCKNPKKDNYSCALRGYNGGYDREMLKKKIAVVNSSPGASGYALSVRYQQKILKYAQDN